MKGGVPELDTARFPFSGADFSDEKQDRARYSTGSVFYRIKDIDILVQAAREKRTIGNLDRWDEWVRRNEPLRAESEDKLGAGCGQAGDDFDEIVSGRRK